MGSGGKGCLGDPSSPPPALIPPRGGEGLPTLKTILIRKQHSERRHHTAANSLRNVREGWRSTGALEQGLSERSFSRRGEACKVLGMARRENHRPPARRVLKLMSIGRILWEGEGRGRGVWTLRSAPSPNFHKRKIREGGGVDWILHFHISLGVGPQKIGCWDTASCWVGVTWHCW